LAFGFPVAQLLKYFIAEVIRTELATTHHIFVVEHATTWLQQTKDIFEGVAGLRQKLQDS
jgi:hypothetical protein